VVCQGGHLYCKECVYENILSQKQSIQQQKKQLEKQSLIEKAKVADAKVVKEQDKIKAFEESTAEIPLKRSADDLFQNNKRNKLNSFWLPSLAPKEEQDKLVLEKEHPLCSFCPSKITLR
jgi:nitric oxide synthase-interacting protein